MPEGVAIALVSALAGAVLTRIVEWRRTEKVDREKWENNLRGAYGVFLNHVYDYRYASDARAWRESYKHAHAKVLLSGSKPVADRLLKSDLAAPPDPSEHSALLAEREYAELVAAMRSDVTPKLRRQRLSRPPQFLT